MKTAFLYRFLKESRYSLSQIKAAVSKRMLELGLDYKIRGYTNIHDMVSDALLLSSKGYIVFVGYSLLTTLLPDLLPEISIVSKELKSRSNVYLIAGGSHATGDPLGTLELGFDFVVHGEAEEVLPTLFITMLESPDSVHTVKGIIAYDEETPIYTGKQKPVVLDEHPPFPYWERIFSPIELTRGCVWGCRYCEVPYLHGGNIRHRSIGNVVYYARLFWRSGKRDLRFITPNAFSYLSNGRTINIDGLCSLLPKLKKISMDYRGRIFMGTFPSEIRPEHAAVDEAVRCMRKVVSNKSIIIGAQSGSNRILKLLNRGHDTSTVIEALETLNKNGFVADVDFIYAIPFEEEDDLISTIEFTERIVSNYKARVHAHYFLPLPGTPLEDMPPRDPPEWFVKRLFKLLGKGLLYGDWLRQRELSWKIVELRRKNVIRGLSGWKYIKRV